MERDSALVTRYLSIAGELLEQARVLALKDGVPLSTSTPRFRDPINQAVDILDEAVKRINEAKQYGATEEECAELLKEVLDVRSTLVGTMEA